ncbi:hypothetical protein M434DRAFT_32814 [Hypoxylon sp. CO27-5]|nr:hypothetical protein M434DRAFT_32814 [Hypoxylon sp. CO27-5]
MPVSASPVLSALLDRGYSLRNVLDSVCIQFHWWDTRLETLDFLLRNAFSAPQTGLSPSSGYAYDDPDVVTERRMSSEDVRMRGKYVRILEALRPFWNLEGVIYEILLTNIRRDPSMRLLSCKHCGVVACAYFTTMSDENSPVDDSEYCPPPDTALEDTNDKIECCDCGEEDYFQHDGDPDNALCKHCAHKKCSSCT